MGRQTDLQNLFESIEGVKAVYFVPPEGESLDYPCIMYDMAGRDSKYADNITYSSTRMYVVKILDRDAYSKISDKLLEKLRMSFVTKYESEGLYHEVYNLYY